MKIAYIYDVIYPYVKGGAEKRFWELARRLSAKGHQVHMFGMQSWLGEPNFIKEGVHIHGVGKHKELYIKTGRRSIKEVLYFTFKIFLSLRREKFDLIDCNAFPYLPFFPIKFLSFFKRIPLIITWQEVWGTYWYRYLGILRGSIAGFIERMVIKLSDFIIVHSVKIKDELINRGVKKDNIRIIPDGIDFKIIQSIPQSNQNSDLIFLGRLIKDKNIDILIKSVLLLKKELNNIKCLIIGEGPEKENLIRLTEKLNLKENIIFKDFLEYEKMISYMKASKIFVFPSTREGFGIVVLEAMACRIPVITVEHPMNAATELIKDGQNGFICKLNEEDIFQKILLLLKNENFRVNIGEKASCYIKDYDWDIITEENERFYNYLLR